MRQLNRTNRLMKLLLASLTLAAATAQAEIPQPGIVLYGKVIAGGEQVTDGILKWTYTPASGSPVVLETSLQELSSPGGETYSYTVTIPAAVAIPGFPTGGSSLVFGDGRLSVTRTAELDGEPLQIDLSSYGSSFSLSADQALGLVERVDLLLRTEADCCPGDADLSGVVTLFDYRAVSEAFGDPTPQTGDANCDSFVNMADFAAVRDHFGESCSAKILIAESMRFAASTTVAGGRLALQADDSTVAPGEAVNLRVLASTDTEGGRMAGIFLSYDPSLMRFDGGTVNTSLFGDAVRTAAPRLVAPGLVAFPAAAKAPLAQLSGAEVGTVRFVATTAGKAMVSLESDRAESMLMDSEYNPIVTNREGTAISITRLGGEPVGGGISNMIILH